MRRALVLAIAIVVLIASIGIALYKFSGGGTTSSYRPTHVYTSTSPTTPSTPQTATKMERVTLTPIPVKYAKLFSLWRWGRYIVVRDAVGNIFVLVPRGSEKPSASDIAKLREMLKVNGSLYVLEVPVKRVVYLSTTEVALLYRLAKEMNDLELLRSIVGVSWRRPWWFPEVQELVDNGTIKFCGSIYSLDYECLVKLSPELVVMYTGTKSSDKVYEKLRSLKLVVAVDNEWLEKSYLARFEWIKFIAAFYGEKALSKAFEIFNKVESVYLELRKEFGAAGKKISFLWFTPTTRYGIWAPKADAYPVKFLESIGGVYVLKNAVPRGGGSVRIDKEVLASAARKADIVIVASYPPYIKSIDDVARIVGDWFLDIPAVKRHRVYFYTPSYWQLGYAYTEKVLLDLASILHPEAIRNSSSVLYGHVRTFFHHLWRASESMKLRFCKGFRVEYRGFYKIVTDYINNTWIVVPRDCVEYVPKDVISKAIGVIRIPIDRVAAGRCGAARLIGLGYGKLIIGATGSTKKYLPPEIRERVTAIGCAYKGLSLEKLASLRPDLYIGGGGLALRPQLVSKIVKELRIPVIVIRDSVERGALSLVEVAKLVAAILDVEEIAEDLLEKNVEELKMISEITSRIEHRPTILYVYYYKGRFGIARGAEPRAQLLVLAGADYALKDNRTGWIKMSLEDFITRFKDVDWIVWTWPRIKSIDDIIKIDPRLKLIKAVREHHVIVVLRDDYCIVMKYNLAEVVKDIASILYPQLFPHHVPKYFGKIQ